MTIYRLTVLSNEVGAIGAPEQSWVYVQAETSKDAYEQGRESLYSKNREHVQVRLIEQDDENGGYIKVEPRAYL